MAKYTGIVTFNGLNAGIVVENLSDNQSVQYATARNDQGKITDAWAYSKSSEISMDGTVESSNGDLLQAGATITIGGKNYLVTACNTTESNVDYKRASITAYSADNVVIQQYSAGSTSSSSI